MESTAVAGKALTKNGALTARQVILRLMIFLVVGKICVFLAVFLYNRSPDFLHFMSTQYDSWIFELIATRGYMQLTNYAFSPFYPALIKGLNIVVSQSWISGLIITNVFSFVFPLILYKTFGYRTALLAELFPTYLVFSTIPYSDVIALVFLALSVLFLMRDRIIESSAAVSLAIFDFFHAAWSLPAYVFEVLRKRRFKLLLIFAVIPVIVAVLIFLWFKIETGSGFSYFSIEKNAWGVYFTSPLTQIRSLLTVQWKVFGVMTSPVIWLLRNLAFEIFYLVGAFLILKIPGKHKAFLFFYTILAIVPLLLVGGTPILSIPRLLLPAFPVFYAYAAVIKNDRFYWGYAVACIILAAGISVIQTYSFFA